MTIKNFLKQIRNLFPSKLPIGTSEFEIWAEDIVSTYEFARSQDLNRSYRFVLASNITTLSQTTAYKAKHYFFLVIKAACAKEIAGGMMYKIKQEQAAEVKAIQEAAANKKAQEAILLAQQASNGHEQ
jgi:uncharacterized protein YegP (UPF0339 family)